MRYFSWLIDFPTAALFLLIIIPILISGGLLKDLNNAFRLAIKKRKAACLTELKKAKEAVSLTIKTLIVSSVFLFFIQGICAMRKADDLSLLGPSMAAAMLAMVYGFGFSLILLPLQSILNVRIQEFLSEQE